MTDTPSTGASLLKLIAPPAHHTADDSIGPNAPITRSAITSSSRLRPTSSGTAASGTAQQASSGTLARKPLPVGRHSSKGGLPQPPGASTPRSTFGPKTLPPAARLQRLVQVFVLLAQATRDGADHVAYLLASQHFALRLLSGAVASAAAAAPMAPKPAPPPAAAAPAAGVPPPASRPATPPAGASTVTPPQATAAAARPAAAAAADGARAAGSGGSGVPQAARLPINAESWATWREGGELVAAMVADGGGDALSAENLPTPEALLASLRVLVDQLAAAGYHLACLPAAHLRRLVCRVLGCRGAPASAQGDGSTITATAGAASAASAHVGSAIITSTAAPAAVGACSASNKSVTAQAVLFQVADGAASAQLAGILESLELPGEAQYWLDRAAVGGSAAALGGGAGAAGAQILKAVGEEVQLRRLVRAALKEAAGGKAAGQGKAAGGVEGGVPIPDAADKRDQEIDEGSLGEEGGSEEDREAARQLPPHAAFLREAVAAAGAKALAAWRAGDDGVHWKGVACNNNGSDRDGGDLHDRGGMHSKVCIWLNLLHPLTAQDSWLERAAFLAQRGQYPAAKALLDNLSDHAYLARDRQTLSKRALAEARLTLLLGAAARAAALAQEAQARGGLGIEEWEAAAGVYADAREGMPGSGELDALGGLEAAAKALDEAADAADVARAAGGVASAARHAAAALRLRAVRLLLARGSREAAAARRAALGDVAAELSVKEHEERARVARVQALGLAREASEKLEALGARGAVGRVWALVVVAEAMGVQPGFGEGQDKRPALMEVHGVLKVRWHALPAYP